VKAYGDYFTDKIDATGKLGFSSIQKCTAAVWMLAYRVTGDLVDEHIHIGESTCLEALYKFCKAVITVDEHNLRRSNVKDTARLMDTGNSRSFLGMLQNRLHARK
jgi:hypothetical protein